jgi:hypothetical protein
MSGIIERQNHCVFYGLFAPGIWSSFGEPMQIAENRGSDTNLLIRVDILRRIDCTEFVVGTLFLEQLQGLPALRADGGRRAKP